MSSKNFDNPLKPLPSQEPNVNDKNLISWNKKQIKKSLNFTKRLAASQNEEEINKLLNENYSFIKTNQLLDFTKLNKYEQEKLKLSELEKERELLKQDMEFQGLFFKKICDENHDYRQIKENLEKLLKEELVKKQQFTEEKKLAEMRFTKTQEEFKRVKDKVIDDVERLKENVNKNLKSLYEKQNELKRNNEKIEELDNNNKDLIQELNQILSSKKRLENERHEKEKYIQSLMKRNEELGKINKNYIEYHKFLHNELQEARGNIRVYCRIRPKLNKEKIEDNTPDNYIEFPNNNTIILNGPTLKSNVGKSKEYIQQEKFKFDCVFKPESSQEYVFQEISQLVQSALDGYKVCIFAYGQTGSGKTFTMEGDNTSIDMELRGIIPRSVEKIFSVSKNLEEIGWKFRISVNMVEIYNDQVRDLLVHNKNNVISTGNKIENPFEQEVRSCEEVYPLLDIAGKKRSTAETMCNEHSSRSHSIFQLKIFGKNENNGQVREGVLNLIDLAGSERVSSSKVEGERLKETQAINKSLSALGNVITALVNKSSHVPYRDTKLTTILQNHLGGDCKTLMFVNISPLISNFNETLNSLKFAIKVNSCSVEN